MHGKACKNTAFHCQIYKFVGFLLPSSSWLLKLPIVLQRTARSYFKVNAAGAVRLLFNIGPIKFFICGIVTVVVVVNSKAL